MARRRKSTSRKKGSSHFWSKLLLFLLLLILGVGFGIWKYPTTSSSASPDASRMNPAIVSVCASRDWTISFRNRPAPLLQTPCADSTVSLRASSATDCSSEWKPVYQARSVSCAPRRRSPVRCPDSGSAAKAAEWRAASSPPQSTASVSRKKC